MRQNDRLRKGLGLFLVSLVIAFGLACNGGDEKNGGDGGANYSGTYYVTIGADPYYDMVIDQSDSVVTFTMEGPDLATEGTGTVSGNTMTLTAPIASEITMTITFSDDGQSFSGTFEVSFDQPIEGSITGTKSEWDTYDVDVNGIPQFAAVDYIELEKIARISKFRSGEGHDYSDDFESCRSMKHYFDPGSGVDPSTIGVFSPVNGTVIGVVEEGGTSVGISSEEHGAFYLVIFHVNLANTLNPGDVITAGQQLGTHSELVSASDIAVGVHTPNGYKLVSYFDVMTDSVFQDYQARGLISRNDAIISKEERDADPLVCDGEEFVDSGNLENWVTLN